MKCSVCGQEMLKAKGCSATHIKYKGRIYKRLTTHFNEESGKCHDCGAEHGNYHHPGCDVERCPICNGQLISCDCYGDEDLTLVEFK